ncbi:NAD-dependent epimerase/dehydratase family protein [Methylobacterium soli]|uniref:NAD-dependent epimerase/dehydratase family protein n=1 Tax=Methylobacterium soli TaxID=553447 RepID=A0A6L3T164_9HYPH|nr:NAD-dependent epimerase/dehydratase family protein [Methylobacterium soli]KAB1080275.1 NAD-dependent epimerase/dehydratase family protein [Methylobacterium soli]GJE42602.1 GDP-6-deoxy-D-mannose reductase [Methylobacterium soli]
MRRVLLSGSGGFLGRSLREHLRRDGVEIASIGIGPAHHPFHFAVEAGGWTRDSWAEALERTQPDTVFHLAGIVRGDEDEIRRVNTTLALDLTAALRMTGFRPTLVVAGSAAEYGEAVIDGLPVAEDAVCAPVTPYGQTKLAQTRAALAFGAEGQCRVVVARIFNPIGPGMPGHLALADFARQIAGFERSGAILRTGDLDVCRDFLDVADVAQALIALAGNPAAQGVVNICSGVPTSLRGLVESMIAASGKRIEIVIDPARLRPGERRIVIGSPERLAGLAALAPPRDLHRRAADILMALH